MAHQAHEFPQVDSKKQPSIFPVQLNSLLPTENSKVLKLPEISLHTNQTD